MNRKTKKAKKASKAAAATAIPGSAEYAALREQSQDQTMDSGSERAKTPPRFVDGFMYRGDFSKYWRLSEQVPRSWKGPKWLDPEEIGVFTHIGDFEYDKIRGRFAIPEADAVIDTFPPVHLVKTRRKAYWLREASEEIEKDLQVRRLNFPRYRITIIQEALDLMLEEGHGIDEDQEDRPLTEYLAEVERKRGTTFDRRDQKDSSAEGTYDDPGYDDTRDGEDPPDDQGRDRGDDEDEDVVAANATAEMIAEEEANRAKEFKTKLARMKMDLQEHEANGDKEFDDALGELQVEGLARTDGTASDEFYALRFVLDPIQIMDRRRCRRCGDLHAFCGDYSDGSEAQDDVEFPRGSMAAMIELRKRRNQAKALGACDYEGCGDKRSHKTRVCPWLHARCADCGLRGHFAAQRMNGQEVCPANGRDNDRGIPICELAGMFEASAEDGLMTSQRATTIAWSFFPVTNRFLEDTLTGIGYNGLLHREIEQVVELATKMRDAAVATFGDGEYSAPMDKSFGMHKARLLEIRKITQRWREGFIQGMEKQLEIIRYCTTNRRMMPERSFKAEKAMLDELYGRLKSELGNPTTAARNSRVDLHLAGLAYYGDVDHLVGLDMLAHINKDNVEAGQRRKRVGQTPAQERLRDLRPPGLPKGSYAAATARRASGSTTAQPTQATGPSGTKRQRMAPLGKMERSIPSGMGREQRKALWRSYMVNHFSTAAMRKLESTKGLKLLKEGLDQDGRVPIGAFLTTDEIDRLPPTVVVIPDYVRGYFNTRRDLVRLFGCDLFYREGPGFRFVPPGDTASLIVNLVEGQRDSTPQSGPKRDSREEFQGRWSVPARR